MNPLQLTTTLQPQKFLLSLIVLSCVLISIALAYPSKPPKIPPTNPLVPTVYSRFGRKHTYNQNGGQVIPIAGGITATTYFYGLFNFDNFLQVQVNSSDDFRFQVTREGKDPKNQLRIGNKNLGGFFKFHFLDGQRPNFTNIYTLTYRTNVKRNPDDIVAAVLYNYTTGNWQIIPSVQLSDTVIQTTVTQQLIESYFFDNSQNSDIWLAFTSGVGDEAAGNASNDYSAASSLASPFVLLLALQFLIILKLFVFDNVQ